MPAVAERSKAEIEMVEGGFASVAEGAQFLGVSRAFLYLLMQSKQVAYAKFGRARRVSWRSLHEYAAKNLVSAR